MTLVVLSEQPDALGGCEKRRDKPMIRRRPSLPHPPQTESLRLLRPVDASPAETIASAERQIEELQTRIDEISAFALETICGDVDESQDVELYDGTLEVSVSFVVQFEAPAGQLKWLDDLAERYQAPDTPGHVAGQRWGSGGLIGKDIFLTAGHCFDAGSGGWSFPQRNGQPITPPEVAASMEVSFKYQVDGTSASRTVRSGERFPVLELIEHRRGGVDYAIVRLGPDENGVLPGDRFGWYEVAAGDSLASGEMLCLIQHPNGQPKRVDTGPVRDSLAGRLTYDSLDTMGGSSGGSSCILPPEGSLESTPMVDAPGLQDSISACRSA